MFSIWCVWTLWSSRKPHLRTIGNIRVIKLALVAASGRKCGPFDMTFLECGAYNIAGRPVHMFPEETAQADLDLGTLISFAR